MYLEPTEACWILGICAVLVVVFLLTAHFTKLKTKIPLFYSWIGAIAIFGGALAFLLPIALNSGFGKDDDGRVLRQLILYATGGLLGVITLGETHRKNNQEKEKNANDHTRQVYAERRSRYTKAVEQLANEKAAVRLGGIYTLVGLVDEWLVDDTLDLEERQKEGQVIINNLCSYIRSPFPLAEEIEEYEAHKELEKLKKTESEKLSEKESSQLQILLKRFKDSDKYEKPENITADYAKFHEEQDVRRTIFVEMNKRSSIFIKNEKGNVTKTIPRPWSDFDFDFSRAPIFYPLNAITIEKGNFYSAKFYSDADFSRATFTQTADFRGATFTRWADFSGVTFTQYADFSGATFTRWADFSGVTFTQYAHFIYAVFTQDADFSRATFAKTANFWQTTFTQRANFWQTTFTQRADFRNTTFAQTADFIGAIFTQSVYFSEATFAQTTDFRGATFPQRADFRDTTFAQTTDFSEATFTHNADFRRATFTRWADFSGATFAKNVYFSDKTFKNHEPLFVSRNLRAKFSVHADRKDYSFEVSESHRPIRTEQITVADGRVFTIPVGCELFDPEPLPAPKPEEPTE